MTNASAGSDLLAESTRLLQAMIRNACVNDGSPDSGNEARNVETLERYFEGSGLELRRFEPRPGRASLLARLTGTDPSAPTLLLMGHIDVVPANGADWQRDPFGADVVDGFVWGRGSVDMLSTTVTMAAATRHRALATQRPAGTLLFLGVADEEAGGTYGARWIVENEPEAVRADFVVTEFGGAKLTLPGVPDDSPILPIVVGEKWPLQCRIVVRGAPGHGSMPYRTAETNASVIAAEVVMRLTRYSAALPFDNSYLISLLGPDVPELTRIVADEVAFREFADTCDDVGLVRTIHALTHTTITPTVVHSGAKTNVIPDRAEVDLDIRVLPGESQEAVLGGIERALGDLARRVEIVPIHVGEPNQSPVDSRVVQAVRRITREFVPGARVAPMAIPGQSDSAYFRGIGIPSYGSGLFGDGLLFSDSMRLCHNVDERIDLESVRLSGEFWRRLVHDVVG